MLPRLFAWERGSVPELPTCISRAPFADSVPFLAPHLFLPPPTSHRLSKEWHLAPPGSHQCDYGSVAPQDRCEAAVGTFAAMAGATPAGLMAIGHGGGCLDGAWGQVPLGCSAQFGSWVGHYKTSGDTGAGCIHQHYRLVCSGFGKPTVLIWTEPSSGGKEERQGWSSGPRDRTTVPHVPQRRNPWPFPLHTRRGMSIFSPFAHSSGIKTL